MLEAAVAWCQQARLWHQADMGLNPSFAFYKLQALNKLFTKFWFVFLLLSQIVRNDRTSLIKLLEDWMSWKCSEALSSKSGHSCSWCSEWPPSLGMTQMDNRRVADISSQNIMKSYCLCFQILRHIVPPLPLVRFQFRSVVLQVWSPEQQYNLGAC